MSVRLKMKCTKKDQFGDGYKIELQPVVGGSPENDAFYLLTPGGQCFFTTVNENAAQQIDLNGEYFLTLESAAQPQAEATDSKDESLDVGEQEQRQG